MYITEEKRPVRSKNRTKKVLRYFIALPPYLMFIHISMMLRFSKVLEKKCYNLMQKFNLLENYQK